MGAFILPPGCLSRDVSPQPGSRKPWCSLEDERRQLQMNECMKLESDADRSGVCVLPSCGFLLFCLGQITVCFCMSEDVVPKDSFGCKRARWQKGLFKIHIENSDLVIFFLPLSFCSSASEGFCFMTPLKTTFLQSLSTFKKLLINFISTLSWSDM